MQDQNNRLSFVQSPFGGASTGDMPVPQQDQTPQMPAVTQMASFLPGTANLNQGGNMFDVSFDPVTHNPFDQNNTTNKTGLYA